MEILLVILSFVIMGAIFGGLGRLAVPGPNPMGIGATILAGIAGSFLGSLVALLVGARPEANPWIFFIFQVLGAALVVWLITRRRRNPAYE